MKHFVKILLFFTFTPSMYAENEETIDAILDDTAYISTRGKSMGGALSPLADGIHAPIYNPAGIGGLHWDKNPPFIRICHFPYLGFSANNNSKKLQNDFQKENADKNGTLGKSVAAAHAGKRQYARFSDLFGTVFGRFALLGFNDTQFAAIQPNADVDLIRAAYREVNGVGAGFSVVNSKENIYLGAFTSYQTQKRFSGDFAYFDIIDQNKRGRMSTKNMLEYDGISTNIGLNWMMAKRGRPTIAIVDKDVGGTHLKLQNKKSRPSAQNKIINRENTSVAFSLSPSLGKTSFFNFAIEASELTNPNFSLDKKFKTGVEYNYSGFGSDAAFGFRAGLNRSGPSAGVNINLGLLQFEVSSYSEDISKTNAKISEVRYQAVLSVNVLDY